MVFKKKVAQKVEEEIKEAVVEEEVESDEFWTVQQVPTETVPVIRSKDGKNYDLYSAIAELLNRTEE